MRFVLRVRDFAQLSGLLGKLAQLPNVLEARRVAGSARPKRGEGPASPPPVAKPRARGGARQRR